MDHEGKCVECGKKLLSWPVNEPKDWKKRPMHKTCWKVVEERRKYMRLAESYQESLTSSLKPLIGTMRPIW